MEKPKHYFDFISYVYNMSMEAILFSMQLSLSAFLRSGGLSMIIFCTMLFYIKKVKWEFENNIQGQNIS